MITKIMLCSPNMLVAISSKIIVVNDFDDISSTAPGFKKAQICSCCNFGLECVN